MPLINCKVEYLLNWYANCILPSAGTAATFTTTDKKFYVLVVTLKIEGNAKLSKLLSEVFKRSIYWNEYKVTPNKNYESNEYIRQGLDASNQGVNRLFVFPYLRSANFTAENPYDKWLLPRSKIDNYNIEIDGRNFMTKQLMIQLNNPTKSEKYQQDKVITQLVVC